MCKKFKDRYPETALGVHAGAGLNISSSLYHDNSREAFEYALSYPELDWIEVDVQLSSDLTWWLFHDLELSRETNGSGNIPMLPDSYLTSIHYTTILQEKLTRLTDLPSDLKEKTLLLDVKEYVESTQQLIDSAQLITTLTTAKNHFSNGKVALICNSGRFVQTWVNQGFIVYLNCTSLQDFSGNSSKTFANGAVFRLNDLTSDEIKLLTSQGKESIIYDIRSPKSIRKALKLGASVVLTDDIKAAIIEKYKK